MNCPGAGDECTCGHDLDSLADSIAGGTMIKYYQADFEFVPEDALWYCTITARAQGMRDGWDWAMGKGKLRDSTKSGYDMDNSRPYVQEILMDALLNNGYTIVKDISIGSFAAIWNGQVPVWSINIRPAEITVSDPSEVVFPLFRKP